jgi:hypothetical protein
LGNTPQSKIIERNKKGKSTSLMQLSFEKRTSTLETTLDVEQGKWLSDLLHKISPEVGTKINLSQLASDFKDKGLGIFYEFSSSQAWQDVRNDGLLFV